MFQLKCPALLLLVLCLPWSLGGETKTWRQSSDLGNPEQWLDGRLPCPGGQRVVLPAEVAFLPSSLALGPEVILPETGMLLFPPDGNLRLVDEESASLYKAALARDGDPASADVCSHPGDAYYRRQSYRAWHDPSSWREGAVRSGRPSARPHLHRIPCRHDTVVFPERAAYKVAVAHHDVDVSHLEINGRAFDSVQFRAIQNSPVGKLMFQVNRTVTVHGDHCYDPEGCMCGNRPLQETICSMSGSQCLESSLCSDPLMPEDHCCYDVCGAAVHVETQGQPLKISMLDEVVQTHAIFTKINNERKENWKSVDTHISRVLDNHYQLVFVDKGGRIKNAIDAARDVYKYLDETLSAKGMYVWMEESGTSPPSALAAAARAFGYFLLIVVVVCLVYASYTVYSRWPQGQPVTASTLMRSVGELRQDGDSMFGGVAAPAWPRWANFKPSGGPFRFGMFKNDTGDGAQLEMNQESRASPARVEVLDPSAMTFRGLASEEEENATTASAPAPAPTSSFDNPMYANPFAEDTFAAAAGGSKAQEIEVKEEESGAKSVENPTFDKLISMVEEEKKEEEKEAAAPPPLNNQADGDGKAAEESLENAKEREKEDIAIVVPEGRKESDEKEDPVEALSPAAVVVDPPAIVVQDDTDNEGKNDTLIFI